LGTHDGGRRGASDLLGVFLGGTVHILAGARMCLGWEGDEDEDDGYDGDEYEGGRHFERRLPE
jgi:hypothetical protein